MKIGSIKKVVVAKSGVNNPRNDTASVVELGDGRLMLVWHKYTDSKEGGSDFGICRIHSKISKDGGQTWEQERLLIDVNIGDLNVQAPALCMLPSGELLLICMRAHANSSSSMVLYRSQDDGATFVEGTKIWDRSQGQWLQGGTASLVRLHSGRLLIPFHGGVGRQQDQHNIVKCYLSDDEGHSWRLSQGLVDLPMRGAMEASVAEVGNGELVMSLRTQLGAVFISRSYDGGETWDLAQTSGLKSGESCTCLRKMPNSAALLLIWNDSDYIPNHHHFGARTPLSLAVSEDGGQSFSRLGNIDDGEFEFTNLNCTFIKNGQAVITYMKVEDPGVKDGKNIVGGGIPFKRVGMSLCAAIVDIEM